MNAFARMQRRPMLYGGLALAAVQLFIAAPGLEAQMQEQEARRAERMAERRAQADMRLEDKARAERSEIALARYKAGCRRVINRDNNDKPIALSEGEPVLDYYNQKPIAPGLVVCDSFGVTGVIDENQKVSDLAVLLDLSLIPNGLNEVNGGNQK